MDYLNNLLNNKRKPKSIKHKPYLVEVHKRTYKHIKCIRCCLHGRTM